MGCSKRKVIITSTITTFIVLMIVYSLVFYKPSITTATHEQLTEIYGIGNVTAQDIIYYCDDNKNATVEDLEYINGIGDKTIELLRERWK